MAPRKKKKPPRPSPSPTPRPTPRPTRKPKKPPKKRGKGSTKPLTQNVTQVVREPEPRRGYTQQGVIPVPLGVGPGEYRFSNDWGNPRSGGRRHEGTDIFARAGTPVISPVAGKVVVVGTSGKAGNRVWVRADDGTHYFFAHMGDRFTVRVGQRVNVGDQLGFIGDTRHPSQGGEKVGNARGTDPHVHFGVSKGYATGWMNPFPLLTKPSTTRRAQPGNIAAVREQERRGPIPQTATGIGSEYESELYTSGGYANVPPGGNPLAPISDEEIGAAEREMGVGLGGAKGMSRAAFTRYVRETAKSRFPGLSSYIDQGGTTRTYAEPYIQLAARRLGVNPNAIDLMDSKWGRAIDTADPKTGQRAAMSLSDWDRLLREDSIYRYDESPEGMEVSLALGQEIRRTMGYGT